MKPAQELQQLPLNQLVSLNKLPGWLEREITGSVHHYSRKNSCWLVTRPGFCTSGGSSLSETENPESTTDPEREKVLNPIIILIPVALVLLIISMIVFCIFISRRWKKQTRHQGRSITTRSLQPNWPQKQNTDRFPFISFGSTLFSFVGLFCFSTPLQLMDNHSVAYIYSDITVILYWRMSENLAPCSSLKTNHLLWLINHKGK